jgi:hypothetical protein
MRFEMIGFWTIEFEDRTLMVARARAPRADNRRSPPSLVLSRVYASETFVAFVLHGLSSSTADVLKLTVSLASIEPSPEKIELCLGSGH